MKNKILELEKRISEQDTRINKLIATSSILERRLAISEKKLYRQHHSIRTQTNTVNYILKLLNKER